MMIISALVLCDTGKPWPIRESVRTMHVVDLHGKQNLGSKTTEDCENLPAVVEKF